MPETSFVSITAFKAENRVFNNRGLNRAGLGDSQA